MTHLPAFLKKEGARGSGTPKGLAEEEYYRGMQVTGATEDDHGYAPA